MNEEIEFVFDSARESMQAAIDYLGNELTKVRAGRSNPSMLSSVKVDYYGSLTPLSQVANVSTPDGRTLSVQPWEKALLQDIERAIINANLGFNPQNNGDMIIISLPPLTEERRLQLVKQCKAEGENAKVSIRNVRKEAMDQLKKLKADGMPEDIIKSAEDEVQEITNAFTKKTDELVSLKEKDILTV